MTETATDETASRGFLWLWPLAVPVLPVLFAVVLLQYVGAPGDPAAEIARSMARDGAAALRHTGDRMNFAAAAAIHTGLCLGAIVYYWMVLRRIAASNRAAILTGVAVCSGGVIALLILLSQIDPPLVIYRVTYFFFDAMLRGTVLAGDLIGAGPPGSLSPLAVAVIYPSALGIVSVIMAAGVACAVLRRIGPPHADGWAAAFRSNIRILFHCFYALSAVLVTSSATALLFFRLPDGLVAPDASEAVAAVSSYAATAATFWGAVYTLTLFAVFVGPMTTLYARARRHVEDQGTGQDLFDWLGEHGLDSSVGANVKNLVVVIAPLLVGPLGELTGVIGG